MSDDSKQIAELKAEVEKLKTALTPTPNDAAAVGAWRDQMHRLSEARASVNTFSRADLEEFERAAPTHVVRAIVGRDSHAPTGRPGTIPNTQQPTASPRPEGNRSGWANPAPLSVPPGTHLVDRLCELDSARERGARMIEAAKIKAAEEK